MTTLAPCDELFEEFILSLVVRTRELKAALFSSACNGSTMFGASTPQSRQQLAASLTYPTNINAQCAAVVLACCEEELDSSLLLPSTPKSPLSCADLVETPRSPRSVDMFHRVPSPRAHSPDFTVFGTGEIVDLVDESFAFYTHAPVSAKVRRAAERWQRFTRELRDQGVTKRLAMLRSVWILNHESRRRSDSGSASSPIASATASSIMSEFTPRTGDVWKHEGTRLHSLVRHPDKAITAVYTCMISLFAAYDLVSFPFVLTFESEKTQHWEILRELSWMSAALWSLDLFMSSFQGFYTAAGAVEMRLDHTILHYLKSWFAFDFILNVTDWITCAHMHAREHRPLQFAKIVRFLRFFRIVRLIRSLERINAMIVESLTSEYLLLVIRLLFLIMMILFISHYISCAWCALGASRLSTTEGDSSWIKAQNLENSDALLRYMASLHWCLTQFTPATTNVAPTNGQERLFAIVVVLLGLVMFSSFVSSLTSAVVELKRVRSSRSAEELQIRRYLKIKRVPLHVCMQIWAYYRTQYIVRKRVTIQSTITFFNLMPAKLRRELHINVYLPVVSQHPAFAYCHDSDSEAAHQICVKAVSEQFITNGQEVFSIGEAGVYMFFLESGTFSYGRQLYDEDFEEQRIDIPHFMSEATLWTKWHHRGTLVAQAPCDVLQLSAADLENLFGDRSQRRFLVSAGNGLRRYATLYAKMISDCDAGKASMEPITDLMVDGEVLEGIAQKAFGIPINLRRHSCKSWGSYHSTRGMLSMFHSFSWQR